MARDTPGRAARSNSGSRFLVETRSDFDDGWNDEDRLPTQVATSLTPETICSIITRNDSPDLPFDRTINPYRGCEHGCIYCYARPTHAYLGLSPGLDFETRLSYKPEAAAVLERELASPRYKPERIQLGASTDPYQPAERALRITRQVLEVLERYGHPVGITTKAALVVRDADILGRMAARRLSFVVVAITTLDRRLARAMEPRAATPERRLQTIKELVDAGVPVTVGVSPVIPGLTDHEMEAILERAVAAGARTATYSTLRMPFEIKDLFREWLQAERPDAAAKVLSLVRQTQGGRDYDPEFGKRMRGQGPVAAMIKARFSVACRRFGLTDTIETLRTDLFAPPSRPGEQLSFFTSAQ